MNMMLAIVLLLGAFYGPRLVRSRLLRAQTFGSRAAFMLLPSELSRARYEWGIFRIQQKMKRSSRWARFWRFIRMKRFEARCQAAASAASGQLDYLASLPPRPWMQAAVMDQAGAQLEEQLSEPSTEEASQEASIEETSLGDDSADEILVDPLQDSDPDPEEVAPEVRVIPVGKTARKLRLSKAESDRLMKEAKRLAEQVQEEDGEPVSFPKSRKRGSLDLSSVVQPVSAADEAAVAAVSALDVPEFDPTGKDVRRREAAERRKAHQASAGKFQEPYERKRRKPRQ